MKRIVFCFDGTSNALNADTPTNVVLAAASINRKTLDGTAQVIYYDEGVGTGKFDTSQFIGRAASLIDKIIGGGWGWGLTENIREAYRFLIFNYDPGDEIFVFGFSRGAFTARSFIGLVRYVGPIRRLHAARIDEALDLYHKRVKKENQSTEDIQRFRAEYSTDVLVNKEDEDWRVKNVQGYVAGTAKLVRIKYLGVWDTVSALGTPEAVPGSEKINTDFHFHDPSITDFIERARHAVAIDERRVLFPPVLFGDLSKLNDLCGFTSDNVDAPYQERWFPGAHGSIGGGGDIRGLSDSALEWILFGAKQAGLSLDVSSGTRIYGLRPDPFVPLINSTQPKKDLLSLTLYQWKTDRRGPEQMWQLSNSTLRRWKADSGDLPGDLLYRPKTLQRLSDALNKYEPKFALLVSDLLDLHVVEAGETLYELANRYYKDRTKFGVIFDANRGVLDDARQLSVGQELRIPKLPVA